ncbi:MAG: STAS domain-containing protein [Spirulinaceae cyanobacterium]
MINVAVCSHLTQVSSYSHIIPSNAAEFGGQLTKLVASQKDSVLLIDMKKVDSLDNTTLMALVAAFRLAQNLGRRLIFCSVAPSVKIILELSQLDRILEIFDSHDAFEATLA